MTGKRYNAFLKIFLALPVVAALVAYFIYHKKLTLECIYLILPHNKLLSVCIIFVLYAVKSITVFIPLIVLNVAVGIVYEPIIAIAVNAVGCIIVLTFPYFLGKVSGSDYANKLCLKYKKLSCFADYQIKNAFWFSFATRAVSCFPGDVVSAYMGALNIPFYKYLAGSFLGTFPGVIAATFLGKNINEPSSPEFLISLCITLLMSVTALAAYYFKKR